MWKILLILFPFFSSLESLTYKTGVLQMGEAVVEVEIAKSREQIRIGLSGREELPEGKGMLFIFDRPRKRSFWMKDTHFPLSIGFFDAQRVLFQIEEMNPLSEGANEWPTYTCKQPSLYALEVPQGWFRQNSIKLGMKFKLSEIESIR